MRNKFIYSVVALLLLFFLIQRFILVSLRNVNPSMELKQLNNNHTTEILKLDEMNNEISENITSAFQTDFARGDNNQITSQSKAIFNYRPGGKAHRFKLIDEIAIDKFQIISEAGRNYFKVVYGIPTVARTQNKKYLIQTLKSLLNDSIKIQKLNVLIIVFVADIDTARCQEVTDLVLFEHYTSFRRGNIEVVCPHPTLYPPLDDLPSTLGDSEDRIKWRSKQNLDFGFLMWYASYKGEYYVQLEDDIIAAKDYAYHIDQHVDKVKDDSWFLIHFSVIGFIGKLMRTNDLQSFASYLLLFYSNQPCDWLVYDYGRSLVCYSGLDDDGCRSLLDKIYKVYNPSLFQHMGTVSSLPGKTMDAKDPLFIDGTSNYSNPPAKITSTFSIYKHYTADILYEGKGYLWSNQVSKGNNIEVEFLQPQELIGIDIRSGNLDYPNDTLQDGVVEFKTRESSDYEHWCGFKEGKANCSMTTPTQVNVIRILALEHQTQWVLITHFQCYFKITGTY